MGESLLMAAWFWYFVLYSFLGFLVEVVFARITHNPKRDRKCLYFLPLCPVYGLGVLLMLALPAAQAQQALEILSAAGETAYQIGEVISGEDGVVLV